jgi:hypothetical protein
MLRLNPLVGYHTRNFQSGVNHCQAFFFTTSCFERLNVLDYYSLSLLFPTSKFQTHAQAIMMLWSYFATLLQDPGSVPAGWQPSNDPSQVRRRCEPHDMIQLKAPSSRYPFFVFYSFLVQGAPGGPGEGHLCP